MQAHRLKRLYGLTEEVTDSLGNVAQRHVISLLVKYSWTLAELAPADKPSSFFSLLSVTHLTPLTCSTGQALRLL